MSCIFSLVFFSKPSDQKLSTNVRFLARLAEHLFCYQQKYTTRIGDFCLFWLSSTRAALHNHLLVINILLSLLGHRLCCLCVQLLSKLYVAYTQSLRNRTYARFDFLLIKIFAFFSFFFPRNLVTFRNILLRVGMNSQTTCGVFAHFCAEHERHFI